ncbi:MAG: aryl-sulfate sulfotransferase [Reichenbachiella sp.]|uniref:aryl-sulfate sulfotransferase n=1 Tax=Reichenbachiella sp. TaxID=2184521 RepID=UPI0032632604
MNKRLLEVVLGIYLLASCSESEIISWPEIEAVQVNIRESIGKTAKIELSLSRPNDVSIDFWPEDDLSSLQTIESKSTGKSTANVVLTNLSENKIYNYAIRLEPESDIDQTHIRHFQTKARPDAVGLFYEEKENAIDSELDGHFLFHKTGHPSVILIVDGKGQVVWYRTSPNRIKVANLTHRNTIISIESTSDQDFSDGDRILETNLAGDTLLLLIYGENDFNKIPHHDLFLNEENQVVFLTQEIQGEISGDGILALDRAGNKVWEWSSFSEFTNPDISTYSQPWANSIIEQGDYYYVSFRALSQIWKIHKVTGKVDWKLGKGGDFELTAETEFLFQHFAHFTSENELLLFDNGAVENRPYSRILSLSLTDQSQTLSPKTNIQLPAAYFSPFMGSVQQLNTKEFLVCSATNGTILNMNDAGQINWKLTAMDRIYRCAYIENIFK